MSVVKSKRTKSTMQYTYNAKMLCVEVLRLSHKIPKRHTATVMQPLCSHTIEVLYHCKAANRIRVLDDATFEARKNHLREALGHLDHVSTLLDILFELLESPSQGTFAKLYSMIDEEFALVTGVLKKDKSVWSEKKTKG